MEAGPWRIRTSTEASGLTGKRVDLKRKHQKSPRAKESTTKRLRLQPDFTADVVAEIRHHQDLSIAIFVSNLKESLKFDPLQSRQRAWLKDNSVPLPAEIRMWFDAEANRYAKLLPNEEETLSWLNDLGNRGEQAFASINPELYPTTVIRAWIVALTDRQLQSIPGEVVEWSKPQAIDLSKLPRYALNVRLLESKFALQPADILEKSQVATKQLFRHRNGDQQPQTDACRGYAKVFTDQLHEYGLLADNIHILPGEILEKDLSIFFRAGH